MEKVFASVRSPLEIWVAVARTSQSPFPLAEMLKKKLLKNELTSILLTKNKLL